jgi:hypothetical protein
MIGNRRCAFALATVFNHLFHRARKCGPVRRKLEHGGCDYQRPLRTNPDRPWNKPRSNLFHRWIFRFLPYSVGRPRFPLGAGTDEGSGWPADRSWDRAVQSVSGQRDVGRYRALRSLLGRLERHSLLKHIVLYQNPLCSKGVFQSRFD